MVVGVLNVVNIGMPQCYKKEMNQQIDTTDYGEYEKLMEHIVWLPMIIGFIGAVLIIIASIKTVQEKCE